MRTPRTKLALVLAALAALIVLPAQPASAVDVLTIDAGPVAVGPGVTFTRYKWVTNDGQPSENTSRPVVLEIAPFANGATIDAASASTKILMSAKVSKMATDHGAYGAISGDFGIKRPDHVFLEDGKMWGSGLQNGGVIFGFRKDEAGGYVGPPKTKISYLDDSVVEVKRWNSGKPGPGEIVAFSPEGGTQEIPPVDACSVLLTSPSAPSWTTGQKLVSRTFTVDKRKCSQTSRMAAPTGSQVVLSSKRRGAGKTALGALTIGSTIKLRFGTAAAGAVDVVGGRQHMVVDGAAGDVSCIDGDLCEANPRTGVGINQACTNGNSSACRVYYVVVDGRQGAGWSQGLTLANFARFMYQELDVWDAANLDGGGSATMWVRKPLPAGVCQTVSGAVTSTGCVVNRPSTNGSTITERGSENSLLVKPSPDTFPSAEPGGL